MRNICLSVLLALALVGLGSGCGNQGHPKSVNTMPPSTQGPTTPTWSMPPLPPPPPTSVN